MLPVLSVCGLIWDNLTLHFITFRRKGCTWRKIKITLNNLKMYKLGAAKILSVLLIWHSCQSLISPAHQRGLVLVVNSHSSNQLSSCIFPSVLNAGNETVIWRVGTMLRLLELERPGSPVLWSTWRAGDTLGPLQTKLLQQRRSLAASPRVLYRLHPVHGARINRDNALQKHQFRNSLDNLGW